MSYGQKSNFSTILKNATILKTCSQLFISEALICMQTMAENPQFFGRNAFNNIQDGVRFKIYFQKPFDQ
jgi:hypothetical protein